MIELRIMGRKYLIDYDIIDNQIKVISVITGGEDITSSLNHHDIELITKEINEVLVV